MSYVTFMMTSHKFSCIILMTGMTALMTLDHQTDLEGTERIRSRAYDTQSTLGEISRHRSISEYTCEKELDEKPNSIRLLNVNDHLTLVCRLYQKGSYKID
jgi:hypothetical protein